MSTLSTALFVICAVAPSMTASQRVIAVGDVHGASVGLEHILRRAGLVDDSGHWNGRDAILVQMGDMLDRGRDVRGVMDLLMRLQDEAPRTGGRVEVLMGNHEAMNLLGIRRDVNVQAYDTFADTESAARLEDAWDRYARYQVRRERAAGRPVPDFGDADRQAWLDALPLGWLEYVEAMSANGLYGQWLRHRPAAIEIGDVLFVHGGVSPEIQGLRPEALNRRLAEELEVWDDVFGYMVEKGLVLPWSSLQEAASVASASIKARNGDLSSADARSLSRYAPRLGKLRGLNDWFLLSPDGPLWFRGLAVWDEAGDAQTVFEILDGLGVRRMVIAHTTAADGWIETRFDDRVVLVDTGMLGPPSYPRGRPSALEIVDGGLTAIYMDGRQVLVPSGVPGQASTSSERLVPRLEMVAGSKR
jgi:hypothetical protein